MRKTLLLALVIVLATVATVMAAGERTGKQVFDDFCLACHETGMMDAPIYRSPDFDDRIKEKGFDKMLENAMNGLDDMPEKGECEDCTKAEIKAAIKLSKGC